MFDLCESNMHNEKMMLQIFVSAFVIFLNLQNVEMHSYHLGACPNIEPVQGFSMNKMLGIWYAVQKTSTASNCIVYNFTQTDEPEEYHLEQTSQHFALGLTPLKHEYSYTGRLTVPDSSVPSKMIVKFPLSVAGSASYTVFMTDYENYAAIFTCQKLTFAHRQSATILSRTRTLDKVFIDKIRMRLASYNIDPYDLSIISQKDCPRNTTGGVDIDINPHTFSSESIAGVVRKAGEKIGDGVEFVAEGAKKLYSKVTNDDDKKESVDKGARYVTPDPETEWLP